MRTQRSEVARDLSLKQKLIVVICIIWMVGYGYVGLFWVAEQESDQPLIYFIIIGLVAMFSASTIYLANKSIKKKEKEMRLARLLRNDSDSR